MGESRRADRGEWLVLAAILAGGAWLRLAGTDERELWLDEMTRVRMSLLSWDAVWERLPHLDPIKSPYLVLFHKAWTALAGTGSLLAMRGYGIAMGLGLVLMTWAVARRVLGRGESLAAAALVAAGPFFVRHSIEVHTYGPSILCLLGVWFLALGPEPAGRGRVVLAGLLAGLAVGTFPASAVALLPLLALPSVRRLPLPATLPAALLAAAVALPAGLKIAESMRIHAPAYEAGIAWSPYFSARSTPFEVFAHLAGADVRQGRATDVHRAGTLLVLGLAAASLLFARRRDEGWTKRALLLAAGLLPPLVLAAASLRGVSTFNDRYVHGAAALLPAAFVGAIGAGFAARSDGGRGRAAAACALTAGAVVAATLTAGLAQMTSLGAAFPKDTASYRYECNALVEEAARRRAPPPVLLVHGEAQASQTLLRVAPEVLATTELRHLTTRTWVEAERAGETGRVAIPHAHGWPFGLTEFAGRSISVDAAGAAALLRASGGGWVLLERERVNRQKQLEEEETPHVDAALDALRAEPSPARDAEVARRVLLYLGLPDTTPFEVASTRNAALVMFLDL